jgi:putative ubiquitin-RnfH superfamily antitoxin RatB of RatAB toxin-antitoxin module
MALENTIPIEVVYAQSAKQIVVEVSVPAGATVADAIALSRVQLDVPNVDDAPVGIHGRLVSRDTVLRDGDRVEIYRALVADAKHARRQRAGKKAV